MLPEYALDRLTAEDLRLLLNGVGDIHVGTLISYTTFNDESNEKSDKLIKLKRWLWGTVEKMTSIEKQDLVSVSFYFSSKKQILQMWRALIVCDHDNYNKNKLTRFAVELLDGIACVAGVRGGLPADANCEYSTGGRRAPAHGQHVYIAALYSTVF